MTAHHTWNFNVDWTVCGKYRIIALLTKVEERHPNAVSPNSDIWPYSKSDWERAPNHQAMYMHMSG